MVRQVRISKVSSLTPLTALSDERVLERWFHRRGMTSLLSGTPVHRSTSVRAAPALVVLFMIEMAVLLPQYSDELSLPQGVALTAVVLAATWVGANISRRRRPFAPIERIGRIEGAVFILVPALSALIAVPIQLSRQAAALDTAQAAEAAFDLSPMATGLLVTGILLVLQTLLLVLVLTIVNLGVLSLVGWLAREVFDTLAESQSALSATLPVLLGVVFFFFFNPGVWVSVGQLDSWAYLVLILLLLALGGLFLGSRQQLDLEPLKRFAGPDELGQALAGTPASAVVMDRGDAERVEGASSAQPVSVTTVSFAVPAVYPTECPLTPQQELNLRLVGALSRMVVASVGALAVLVFFVVLGWSCVDAEVVSGWTRHPAHVLWEWETRRRTYILSLEHLRVSGFLAAFAAFYYSLASATDARLREGAKGTATVIIRQACAMRLVLVGTPQPAGPPPETSDDQSPLA